MATKKQVISNFAKQPERAKNGSRCNGGGWGGGGHGGVNIFYEGRILYSHGHHFPLAIRHKDAGVECATGFGAGVHYIINGDKYSVSTTRHQNECISTLKGNVQIPFSALQEAWNWAIASSSLATNEAWKLKVRNGADLAYNLQHGFGEFQVVAWNKDEWIYQGVDEDGKTLTPWMTDEETEAHRKPYYAEHKEDCPCAEHRSQHRLGAVLFKIREHSFLSSFDELDRRNYFLCHVPGSPGTVEEALEMLKPMEIKLCEKAGATILRQGDWFFYQASEPAAELAKWLKQQAKTEIKQYRLGGTTGTHTVTRMRRESPGHAMLLVSGTVRHSPTDGRSPEHKRLKLGDGKSWWIPVKNTSEAGWGAVGNVD